jgi:RNA polymerase sigma-70 factor (ECF subfamily)
VNADDQRLIADCLRGQTAAFEELVRRHQDRLYNAVNRLVGNPEDARDIVQDAFLSAYQSLAKFKGGAQFYTWLYRIAFNAAISLKRKQRVALAFQTGRSPGAPESEPADPSEQNRPDERMLRAEEERRVQAALAQLSAEHRAVLILKDIEGQRYEAIALVLGVPIGTVRSRLHRARMELREILRRDEE